MAFRKLIKSKSFLFGFVIGGILTFGSASVSVLGGLVEFVFDYINSISPLSELKVWGSVIHSYLLSLAIFLIVYYLTRKRLSVGGFKRFSWGFLSVYLIYFILALVAISQFKFTQ